MTAVFTKERLKVPEVLVELRLSSERTGAGTLLVRWTPMDPPGAPFTQQVDVRVEADET